MEFLMRLLRRSGRPAAEQNDGLGSAQIARKRFSFLFASIALPQILTFIKDPCELYGH